MLGEMFVGSRSSSATGLAPIVHDAIHSHAFSRPSLRWDIEPVHSPILFLIFLSVMSEMSVFSTVVTLAGLCSSIVLRSSSAVCPIAIGTNLGGKFVDGDAEGANFFVLIAFSSDLWGPKVLSFETPIFSLKRAHNRCSSEGSCVVINIPMEVTYFQTEVNHVTFE